MPTVQSLVTLQGRVEYILSNYPATRNSDLVLQAELAYNFYPPLLEPITNWRDIVYLMRDIPSLDHIARVRRKVVEKNKKLIPTDPAVAKGRKISEETWRQYATQKPVVRLSNVPVEYQMAESRDDL